MERIKDNSFKLEFPGDTNISTTFNVGDLSPYLEDGLLEDLRANPSQPEEVDVGASMLFSANTKSAHFMSPSHLGLESYSYFGFRTVQGRSIIFWQPNKAEESP